MARRRINLSTPGFVHRLSLPLPTFSKSVPDYVLPGFDHCDGGLEPHIEFDFHDRLYNELELRNPDQPFPGDPLPDEQGDPIDSAQAGRQTEMAVAASDTKSGGRKVITLMSSALKARHHAKLAAEREERYRKIQANFLRQRTVVAMGGGQSSRTSIMVAEGAAIDPALIEDREYDLDEVVGSRSRFNLRLIPWGAG
jgi:hypothetical protein